MIEAEIQARICLAIGAEPGVRIFRNTVGRGWTGDEVKIRDPRFAGFVVLRNARRVTFGLAPGSHDLIGWRTVIITPDMIGSRIAQFTGGEIKRPGGTADSKQRIFIDALAAAGGFSAVWRDPESALRDVRSSNLSAEVSR